MAKSYPAIFLILCLSFPGALRADDYENIYPISIHIHSDLSSGVRPITQIAEIAEKQNVRGIILTDLYEEKYEYGIRPLQGILKKTVLRDSIMKSGPEVYFREIERARTFHPNVLIIDGTAVTPFYYWTGNLWPGPLVLNARARDLLILGLKSPSKYEK